MALSPRVSSGMLVALIVLLCAFFGQLVWVVLSYLGFVFIYRELKALMTAKGIAPSRFCSLVFCSLFYIFAWLGWQQHFDVLITLALLVTFTWMVCRPQLSSINDIGATFLLLFYAGYLPAHFIVLRQLNDTDGISGLGVHAGLFYVLWVLCTVSATDIAAYVGGKRFGKNLLSPHISPAKTIEGSITGIVGALLMSISFSLSLSLGWLHGICLGLLLALTAQMGDLSESLLKRDAGVKDSGSLIPGHGGVLDRIDSYILSGAVAYYYINWFIRHQGFAQEWSHWFQS